MGEAENAWRRIDEGRRYGAVSLTLTTARPSPSGSPGSRTGTPTILQSCAAPPSVCRPKAASVSAGASAASIAIEPGVVGLGSSRSSTEAESVNPPLDLEFEIAAVAAPFDELATAVLDARPLQDIVVQGSNSRVIVVVEYDARDDGYVRGHGDRQFVAGDCASVVQIEKFSYENDLVFEG
jgi:hypothetical protein